MKATSRAALVILLLMPAALDAQDYRVRLDARMQSVWFRGLTPDSISAAEVDTIADGVFQTPEGLAVRCAGGSFCYFFRPGPALRGIPVSATASMTVWRLGVEGLSMRGTARLIGNLGDEDAWPSTEPAAQLLEGIVEYQRESFTARAGRQLVSSRLETAGFDGGWLRYRWSRIPVELTGYAGWGFGQATALSPISPVLNPLDEWRPRDRQIVAGVEAMGAWRSVDMKAEYRREIDPEDDYFVSERAALSLGARARAFRFNSGFDYNIAEGRMGSADAAVTWIKRPFSASLGARRYRPYFSLWTLWGAFSPVPYNAVHISAETRLIRAVSVHGRVERFGYDDAEVSTGLVPQLEDRGWRFRLGSAATFAARWALSGDYEIERGPGAAARSGNVAVSYSLENGTGLDLFAGSLSRPLELRFYDAKSSWVGARGQLQLGTQRRVWAEVSAVNDERDRPDDNVSSLDQMRIRAGASITFGNGADRAPLPPARRPTR